MTPQLIDLSNYDTALVQSSQGRAGAPDGNIFFDVTNDEFQIITASEKPTIDLHGGVTTGPIGLAVVAAAGTFTRTVGSFLTDGFSKVGASVQISGFTNGGNNTTKVIQSVTALVLTVTDITGLVNESAGGNEVIASVAEANPLTNALGIKFEALYAFENQERRTDENLRKYDRYFKGTFKFGGAYEMINGRKFETTTSDTGDDRTKIRGSGWNERALNGALDRIYFGNKGLGVIQASSQPYYQLSSGGAPVNFAKPGNFDEAVQVFGTTANGDTGAGSFDSRTYEAVSIRTFGYNYDRKETTTDLSIAELGGYSTGFAVSESVHLTTGDYNLADVYGAGKISPWTGMTLEKLAAPQAESGFNEAAGNFTWVLNNTANGNLNQCVAFLDALAQTDDDVDSGAISVTNGKRVGTWYSYNASGQIVTRSGAGDGKGLFIENIPTADEQRIVFTDDLGALKTRPFNVSVSVDPGSFAIADALAWYHAFFLNGPATNDFNTATAITVRDASDVEVKGNVAADVVALRLPFTFDYDGDTYGGTAGTDKDVVFEVEGDGGATAAKTIFTLSRTATINVTCAPGLETNQ